MDATYPQFDVGELRDGDDDARPLWTVHRHWTKWSQILNILTLPLNEKVDQAKKKVMTGEDQEETW